jgi:hypothetical protein
MRSSGAGGAPIHPARSLLAGMRLITGRHCARQLRGSLRDASDRQRDASSGDVGADSKPPCD